MRSPFAVHPGSAAVRVVPVVGGWADQGQHQGWGGAGHAGIEMVLGDPVAQVAEVLGPSGQVEARAQRVGGGATGRDRYEIEYGEWNT